MFNQIVASAGFHHFDLKTPTFRSRCGLDVEDYFGDGGMNLCPHAKLVIDDGIIFEEIQPKCLKI